MSTSLASSSSVSRPPVADGLPLIGSLIPMLGDPAKFMTAQYLKHGPVFQVKVLNNAFTVLAGPEAVEYMTTEDDTLTGEPMWKQFVTQFGGQNNITAMDGPDHARLRKVMRRGFSRTAALETSSVTIAATRRLLHGWAPGTPIPAAEFIVEVIAEVLGSITLGRASGEYLPDFLIMWRNYLWAKVIGIKSKDVLESAEYKRALARVVEMAEGILRAYERGELQPGESQFADDLITASKEQPDLVGRGDLILGLIAPYVAGLDTVASIVMFAWYEIVRDPMLRERLMPEINALLATDSPQPEQVRQLPLLHATIMETLRYYNVAVMLPRIAKKDFVFGGRQIMAGDKLQMALGVVHRLEKFYPNPEQFDIDRFLDPRNEHKQRHAFAPYGAGAHTCLGAGMAEVIMALMVATIIHDADYALHAGYPVKRFISSSLKPAPELRIRVTGWR